MRDDTRFKFSEADVAAIIAAGGGRRIRPTAIDVEPAADHLAAEALVAECEEGGEEARAGPR